MDGAIIEDEDPSLGCNYISSVRKEDLDALTGALAVSIGFVCNCIQSSYSPVRGKAMRAASWQRAFRQECC